MTSTKYKSGRQRREKRRRKMNRSISPFDKMIADRLGSLFTKLNNAIFIQGGIKTSKNNRRKINRGHRVPRGSLELQGLFEIADSEKSNPKGIGPLE